MHRLTKGKIPETRCNSKFATTKLHALLLAHSFTRQETTYKVIKHHHGGITIEMFTPLKLLIEKMTDAYNKDLVNFTQGVDDKDNWTLLINFNDPNSEQVNPEEKIWSCILCRLAFNLEKSLPKKKNTKKVAKKVKSPKVIPHRCNQSS
jgi:hypothetical protein